MVRLLADFVTGFSRLLLVLAACAALSAPVTANSIREIAWNDLLPGELEDLEQRLMSLRETLFALDKDQRQAYQRVGQQLQLRDKLAGSTDLSELGENERALLEQDPASSMPEAVAFWEAYQSAQEAIAATNDTTSATLDGQAVRMPGYLLPLEYDGDKVREFLLVPYVGACIHTPPPPRNQMVFVKAPGGYKSTGLYQPVWVEGAMSTQGSVRSLHLVDGANDLDVGYTLNATKVEAYQQ